MGNKEIIRRIKEHMIVHKLNEPQAVHITEALNSAIKALEEQEANRWIPVSERLPDKDGEYLVNVASCYGYTFEIGDIDIYRFEEGKFQTDTPIEITYWRPLPKAPESEDK